MKKMMKGIIKGGVLLVSFFLLIEANAQEEPADYDRLEFNIKGEYDKPIAIPAGSDGVFLLKDKEKSAQNGSRKVIVAKYNTDFTKSWEQSLTYPKKKELKLFEYVDGSLYMIFYIESQPEILILSLDAKTGNHQSYNFYYLKKLDIKDLSVADNRVYLAGKLKNNVFLVQLNLDDNTTKTLPAAFSGKHNGILEIYPDPNTGNMGMVVSTEVNRRKSLVFRSFDREGRKSSDVFASTTQGYDLINGKLTLLNGQKYVLGTYGYVNNVNSQGMFVAPVDGTKANPEHFYSFTEFDNFFNFLDEKALQKTENKVEKKKSKGKDLKINYRLLIHDLLEVGDENVMIGEAYYPVFKNKTYTDYFRGRPRRVTRRVFDGYKYTHAVIAGLDKNGKLLWDHSFKIKDVKSFVLDEKVKANVEGDVLSLLYNFGGKINTIEIKGSKIVGGKENFEVAQKDKNALVKRFDLGDAAYWFDNYFLAWGYQQIKIKEPVEGKKKRNIFYLNKMSF